MWPICSIMPTPRRRVAGIIGRQNGGRADQVGHALANELIAILDQFVDASEEIMLEAMRPTFEKSQTYCPVESGRLKKTGYLEVVPFRGKPRVEIGYGKGQNPRNRIGRNYTAYVHEMIDLKHQPPTRAKWLQAAVMEDLELIHRRLGYGYEALMRQGG